jgi:diguanylate cyclase (GGDEF)-like protein
LLRVLTLPGGLLVLAAVAFLRWAPAETVAAAAHGYPYVVFGAGILLAWRFNRSGMVFALLTVALSEAALARYAAASMVAGQAVFAAVALLLPVNLGLFSLLPEQGTWLRRATLGLGLLGGQVLLVAALVWWAPQWTASVLGHSFGEAWLAEWTPVPQLGQLAFLLGLIFFAFLAAFGRRATDHGFLWALLAAFLALDQGAAGTVTTIYMTTAGLILGVAVVEASFRLAYRDELTRLPTRRALNEALTQLGEDYAVAMVDVDHFKKFNDTYGHKAGDQVLRMVGSKLERVSGGGRPFRYGGEEFSVLFPGKGVREALPHLEALREEIQDSRFALRAPGRPRRKPRKAGASTGTRREVAVTVSVGVAEAGGRHPTPEQVIQAADKALYRAKKAGRNQVKT